jgi:hypothetical protein
VGRPIPRSASSPAPVLFAASSACAALLTAASAARASAFEVYGFGPAGVADVNARAARADDGTAAFYNPGGLGLGQGVRLELSPTLGVSALEAQGEALPLESPFGLALAFDATVPFEGALEDRIRFGFGGYFLTGGALRLISRAGDAPFFPYYDNRTQRLVAIPAIAVRIVPGLAIGAGCNVLAGVSGPADVQPGASGAPEPRIDEEVTSVLAANLGARFDPTPHARFAFTYRQRFAIESSIPTTAEVGGVPLDVDVDVRQALFDPDTFVVASSFDIGRATLEIDVSYAVWSTYDGPFVAVHAELPGVNISSKNPEPFWRDVVSARAAGSYRVSAGERADLVLRAGAGFEPSMLESNVGQGRSNLVDSDKVLVGLGASLTLRDVLPVTVRLALGVNTQIMTGYEQAKKVCAAQPCPANTVVGPDGAAPGVGIDNPGFPVLSAGGSLWSGSFGLGVDL